MYSTNSEPPDTLKKRPLPFGNTGAFSAGRAAGWQPLFSEPAFFLFHFCMLRTEALSLRPHIKKFFQKESSPREDTAEILAVIQPLCLHPLRIKFFFPFILQIFRNVQIECDHIQPSLVSPHPFGCFCLLLFTGKPANSNPAHHSKSPAAMDGPDSGRNTFLTCRSASDRHWPEQ